MSERANLLVELFVEELPPKALRRLGDEFASALAQGLRDRGLATPDAAVRAFASPRRLAVHVSGVARAAADQALQQKLMPATVGLDAQGKPTQALLKKLSALGLDASAVERLKRAPDGKVEALFIDTVVRGATLADGLQQSLNDALARLPIPKVMSYQLEDGWTNVSFVRPAHGLVALHGSEVVPLGVLGLKSGRTTHGHRFEAASPSIEIASADSYAQQLETEGAVVPGFDARRAMLVEQLQAAAAREGLRPIEDDALLDEVTALVERPNVLVCRFDETFLEVPQECLILTMKANQKYFPLLDAAGRLTARFLVVSNIRPADPGAVVGGNERVVRPRLADAKFFFDQDRRRTLESRVPGLDKVVYHGKLGSQGERVGRLRAIARWVAARLGADEALADRAALLAKADLLTDMVGEFPELQGIMGGYYARHDGEAPEVAAAIAEQYVVRRDEQQLATNLVGEALWIADRAETLVGIWAIGLKPTGEKDPYALRRHALGIMRAFELCGAGAREHGRAFPLGLRDLLEHVASTFPAGLVGPGVLDEVQDFVFERYQNQLAPQFGTQTVDAVVSARPPLHEVVQRIRAVQSFRQLPEAASLAAANKRIGNILRKSDAPPASGVSEELLREDAERHLLGALKAVQPLADKLFDNGEYAASLRELSVLKVPVDAFFDHVMVNAEDPALRANRLGLLARLHAAMNRVADLSRLAA